ncbi:MAG: hypothetical protein ACXWQO_09715 [Bdellovibrionota bacterium]
MQRILLLAFAFLAFAGCASVPAAQERNPSSEPLAWVQQGGIEVSNVDRDLFIVRADPLKTPLELVISPPGTSPTAAQHAQRQGLSVVINAAMFATDYSTSIGYMRNFETVNNPHISAKLRGFLMFNPKDPALPAVKIGDRKNIDAYNTVFQTHRMWDETQGILWNKGASIFHHVGLVGVDSKHRVLFFYHLGLIDVHDMVAQILELGLDLKGLLYLDGGNHGSLYLSRELGQGWNTMVALPNILGLKAAPAVP